MKGSIIVPLDGTRFGEFAIPYAFSIARRAGLPVHLVHVHENLAPVCAPAYAIAGESSDWEIRQNERDYLQRLRDRTRFDQDVEIETALIEGDVAEALDQYVHDLNASLIVMAADSRGALHRFFLGSITDQLVRNSYPPLLLVHPGNEDSEADVDVHLNHLLLPLESAADFEGILKPALELSALFNGDCTLFHVVDDEAASDYAPRITFTDSSAEVRGSCCSESRAHFENLAEHLREKGNKVAVRIVESPYTAASVLEEAKSGKTDWIAISSHRRSRLSQRMFGTTADKIIHGAKVPILVYVPQQD